jgi:hypothetical protein
MRRKIAYILAIALFIVAAYYGFYDNDKAQAITYQKPSPIPQFSVNLVYQNGVPVNKTVSIIPVPSCKRQSQSRGTKGLPSGEPTSPGEGSEGGTQEGR